MYINNRRIVRKQYDSSVHLQGLKKTAKSNLEAVTQTGRRKIWELMPSVKPD